MEGNAYAVKRPAGVTPEMNLRKRVTSMPLLSVNKASHSDFENQRRRHQNSKSGVLVAPEKGLLEKKISALVS